MKKGRFGVNEDVVGATHISGRLLLFAVGACSGTNQLAAASHGAGKACGKAQGLNYSSIQG
jgi:hypothetical protein